MTTLIAFSGLAGTQGAPLPALRELYRQPENGRFFATVTAAVDAALAYATTGAGATDVTGPPHLPVGLPLADWLRGAEPSNLIRHHSMVDGVCAHIYQLCLLQPPAGRTPAPSPAAALGHSLGVQAALAAALQVRRRREYLDLCYHSVLLTTMILIRAHQVAGATPDPALVRRWTTIAGAEAAPPGPMATVTAADRDPVLTALDQFGRHADADPVHLAIMNSTRSFVLAGTPTSLVEFWRRHRPELTEAGARWSFLRSTAPFHSRLLAPAVERLRADREFIGFEIAGDQLAIPVFVSDAPRNLQHRPVLFEHFLEQAISRPVDWHATVTHAVSQIRPEQVWDYGPGPAARMFIRESLRHTEHRLRYHQVPHLPTGRK